MFLVTGEYRIQRDGDVYPYGIFRQISVPVHDDVFLPRRLSLRNQVPDFRRKKLIPVIAYTYYIECLHGLIHLFRFQLFRIIKKGWHLPGVAARLPPFASFYYQFGIWLKGFTMCLLFANVHKAHRTAMMPHGCAFSFRIRSHSSINAAGALPNTYKASGCSSAAIRIPACVRVIPFLLPMLPRVRHPDSISPRCPSVPKHLYGCPRQPSSHP